MSSISQAKAEAKKLIKQYNKLQAEARNADSAEAARKASEADKIVSQISTLQSTITKLQARDKQNSAQVNPASSAAKAKTRTPTPTKSSSNEDQDSIEGRIAKIESAQKKNRDQINQLSRAKRELERLKNEAEQNVERERRANDERLQQELNKLIEKKEAEHARLKGELSSIRSQAEKDAEMLKVQRDAARAMMEKHKQTERENLLASRSRSKNKGLWIGLGTGITVLSLAAVALFTPVFDSVIGDFKAKLPLSNTEKNVHTTSLNAIEKPEEPVKAPPIKETVVEKSAPKEVKVRALKVYQDRLSAGGKGPVMLKLPAGKFLMGGKGSSIHQDERPQFEAHLQSFSIGRYEVTFAEYDVFAKRTGQKLPKDKGWGRGKQPVINVSWHDAVAYTRWLTEQTGHQYRLPSEREWEYAARAGINKNYYWGYKVGANNANCSVCGSDWDGRQTAPVGSFKANNFGLHDVIGNVLEWTVTCFHSSYKNAPTGGQNWEGGDCSRRMVRSSAYRSFESSLRVTKRNKYNPKTRIDSLGFRVVRVD